MWYNWHSEEPQGDSPSGFFVCHENPDKPKQEGGEKPMRKAFNSPEELAQKIDGYFAHCAASKDIRELKSGDIRVRQEIPSMVGLAVFLGIGKSTLYDYAEGKYDKQTGEQADKHTDSYSEVIACARDRIEIATLQAASNGDMDGRVALARLAKFGYSPKVETESKAVLSVQWEGASIDDIDAWGR